LRFADLPILGSGARVPTLTEFSAPWGRLPTCSGLITRFFVAKQDAGCQPNAT
jgi:hypothetical protein